METKNYGKGAVPTPPEVLATRFKLASFAAPVIDWSVPYDVPAVLKQKNQDGSSSCTAQATCYYVEALNQVENNENEFFSPRFIYSQTYLGPNQGTYIWKAMGIPLKQGVALEVSVPGGAETEDIMTDPSLNQWALITDRTDKYAQIPRTNIDGIAQIIKDYHGFVTGFNGHDGMFDRWGMVTDWSRSDWGHAVYVCGYGMRDGKKCLKFKNSWGSGWGDDGCGYLPEDFVNSGMVFDEFVYASILDLDPTTMENRFVRVTSDVWLVKDGKRSLVYNALAFNLVSGDWSKIETITQATLDLIPDTGNVIAGLSQE
jgi:hypothetical protein